MICIFCTNDRPGSDEHVFPLAIGGRLVTDRVCQPCNSVLGARVDSALSDNFMVRGYRARLGLSGNSGVVPEQFELLLGTSDLADKSGRIRVTIITETSSDGDDTRDVECARRHPIHDPQPGQRRAGVNAAIGRIHTA